MTIIIMHEMDTIEREVTLNEAFLEALSLSDGRACEIENAEHDLKNYLDKYPEFINNISDNYKLSVLKGWNYKIFL